MTSDKIATTGAAIRDYVTSHTPEQVAADIKGFIGKNLDALKADHAKTAAQGPEAEARWWGEVSGRALFEIAATFVPVTKAAKLAKAADAADALSDAARVANKADDVTDAARVGAKVERSLDDLRLLLGGKPLNTDTLAELFAKNVVTMDEARRLAKSVDWKDANGRWIYPPNDGFELGARPVLMDTDVKIVIDRFGHPRGRFVSSLGEPYTARALPPGSHQAEYHVYELLKPTTALAGKATPWFD